MPDQQDLSTRIERLEAANRKLKWIAAFLVIFLIAFVAMERMTTKNTVEARQFLLKDRDGKVVARWGDDDTSGTCFKIVGRTKTASAEICAGDNYGASLNLTNHHGESFAVLSAGIALRESLDGSVLPGLTIGEQDGKNLVSATVGSETRLVVGHGVDKDSFVVSAPVGKPTASLFGAKGDRRWTAP